MPIPRQPKHRLREDALDAFALAQPGWRQKSHPDRPHQGNIAAAAGISPARLSSARTGHLTMAVYDALVNLAIQALGWTREQALTALFDFETAPLPGLPATTAGAA